jgi:uncharacterized cupredoxin-like copper-binding protein
MEERRTMKKLYGVGLLLVFCVVLLAACGGASQANMGQMNMGQMSTSTSQANTSTGQDNTSATPTNTGTSQANTSAGQVNTTTYPAHTATAKAVEVQITLTDFHITSSLMTFTAGVPYHFTVINKGKAAHELMLMSTTMKTMNMSGMPMNNMNQMALTSLEAMNPGTTKTFDYTFVLSKAGQHPELSCHLPGHYETGMHLDLTVSQ